MIFLDSYGLYFRYLTIMLLVLLRSVSKFYKMEKVVVLVLWGLHILPGCSRLWRQNVEIVQVVLHTIPAPHPFLFEAPFTYKFHKSCSFSEGFLVGFCNFDMKLAKHCTLTGPLGSKDKSSSNSSIDHEIIRPTRPGLRKTFPTR